ncbi:MULTISPECIES: NAD(P)H-binding protein [Nocardioides]|uniref:NAD(P)H-binding protein n=1 Tax=Nocardioides TaxID=1839 RepID=UPI0009FC4C47|nr:MULTISPECIES: NAD(P)H-binding protein [Nocardioides]
MNIAGTTKGPIMSQILVIGARGKTGRYVASGLVSRGVSVKAASRNPDELSGGHGVPTRFDWHDGSTWEPALVGVDAVYLVKPESDDVVEIVTEFLRAMEDAGVRRLVLLSECATHTRSDDVTERRVELAVEATNLQWTILRPSWFMQDIIDDDFFGPMVRDDGIIVMTTGGSATAWIHVRDIAEVAVELLIGGGSIGQALNLTGPEALTLKELAERITAAAGTPVLGVEETVAEAESRMRRDGFDEDTIAYLTRIVESIIEGHTANVTGDVERIVGHPPRHIDSFLADHARDLRRTGDLDADNSGINTRVDVATDNEALFRRLVAAWASSDFDALLDCFADDMVYTDMPFPDAPVLGKAAFRRHVSDYNALFARGQVDTELVTVVATESHVVGELSCRAQYVGPGAPAEGVPVHWYATLVDTIVDGKVSSEHAYFDPTAFEKAVQRVST